VLISIVDTCPDLLIGGWAGGLTVARHDGCDASTRAAERACAGTVLGLGNIGGRGMRTRRQCALLIKAFRSWAPPRCSGRVFYSDAHCQPRDASDCLRDHDLLFACFGDHRSLITLHRFDGLLLTVRFAKAGRRSS